MTPGLRSTSPGRARALRLHLALALLVARVAGGAATCSTEGCDACDNGSSWSGFTALIERADFPVAARTPVAYFDPADGTRTRLVPTLEGVIWLWDFELGEAGAFRETPFLDLSARVASGTGEQGLLSMLLDPDYRETGELYVLYTGTGDAPGADGDVVVERYRRDDEAPGTAEPASAETILLHPHSTLNTHHGATLLFDRDGFLLISLGDGGGVCDDDAPGSPNGQRLDTLDGKLLRLDVRGVDAGSLPPECGAAGSSYGIPPLQPLAGEVDGCGEIWAYGLRNPFRMTIDRATGDLWIADVGQNNFEEINFLGGDYLPLAAGDLINFGWRCREGCASSATDESVCPLGEGECSGHDGTTCAYPTIGGHTDPVFCHSNPHGWRSPIAGYRYRGTRVPGLAGDLLYADAFCAEIWKSDIFDPAAPESATSACWDSGRDFIYAFAEDSQGELYIVQAGGAISCLHAEGAGCPWADDARVFGDGFESGDATRWSSTSGESAR